MEEITENQKAIQFPINLYSMKTKIHLLFFIVLCFTVHAKAQTVNFTYDNDGNMTQRKILTIPPQNAKAAHKDTVSAPVTDQIGLQKITIYPVPTRGMFQVAVTLLDSKQNNYFCLYSLSGAKILQHKITNESTSIDISTYPPATYLLDVYLGDKVSRWKVIKQ